RGKLSPARAATSLCSFSHRSSLPGLTRQSISFANISRRRMDPRVKPGGDAVSRASPRQTNGNPFCCHDHPGRELTRRPLRGRYNLSKPVHATFSGRAIRPSRREGTMRVMAAAVTAAALAAAMIPAATAARADDAEVGQIVRQHVQPMLIAAGGMAVVVHIDDRTLFFNYGMADVARKEPITSDVLFNLRLRHQGVHIDLAGAGGEAGRGRARRSRRQIRDRA